MTSTIGAGRPGTLVWIDAREAVIVRMDGDRARIERRESEVPAHHRATGHVRHDPGIRHGGGGGRPQSAGEPHRIEHLNRFVEEIAELLAPGDDLLVLGPGTVHERLARQVAAGDARQKRSRQIVCERSSALTDRQLQARVRRFTGIEPRRRSVGAHRWIDRPSAGKGATGSLPRRLVDRPRERTDDEAAWSRRVRDTGLRVCGFGGLRRA